ncbi:OprD family porin, partial [Pseudomonas sp. SAICEU22]|nr:OprD family porin [Pseudomonas agronomica]
MSTRARFPSNTRSNRRTLLGSAPALTLLGCTSLAAFMPLMASAEGFVDDAKATLNLRNAYFNRNFVNDRATQGKAEEWTQSFI